MGKLSFLAWFSQQIGDIFYRCAISLAYLKTLIEYIFKKISEINELHLNNKKVAHWN